MRAFFLGLVMVAVTGPAWPSIVVDGTRDVDYGPARTVQTVQTGFGDAEPPGNLGGNELDAAYGVVRGGRLYLLFTGNLEPISNNIEVFIDSKTGGENTLSGTPNYSFSGKFTGMTFDTGFNADYHLWARWGPNSTGSMNVDFVDRQGGTAATVPGSAGASAGAIALQAQGVILSGNIGPSAVVTALSKNLYFAIDDNNASGVSGGSSAANATAAAAVTTGVELSIALDDLGNPAPGSTIRVVAMINGSNHDYLSNQFLAGLAAPQGNLGGDGMGGFTGTLSLIDLGDYTGNQFFSVPVPAETAIELRFTEYVEGTANSKAVEIHNATGATIDLDAGDYQIAVFPNGGLIAATIDLTGTIAPNGTFVLANTLAAAGVLAAADQQSALLTFDGDDAVVLRQGTIVVDSIGQTGEAPIVQWGTDPRGTANNTLLREDDACRGDSVTTNPYDPAPEWNGFPVDTFDDLGSVDHACSSCGAGGFDVDLDGEIEPLSDGLLVVRHLFGFTGATLVQGALGLSASRVDPATITTYLKCLEQWLIDVDSNGEAQPLSDGLLLLRYFFEFRDATLTTGAVGAGCKRCNADAIEPFIASRPEP